MNSIKMNLGSVLNGKPAAKSALFVLAVMPSVSRLWNQKLNGIVDIQLQLRLSIARVRVRRFDALLARR